jgi:hypothetical protein
MQERVELALRKNELNYFEIIKIVTITTLLCTPQQLYDSVLE